MKILHITAVAAAVLGAVALMTGCTAGMKSLVSPTPTDQPPKVTAPPIGPDATASRPAPGLPPGPEDRSGEPPKYAPPAPPSQKQLPSTLDVGEKDEVNQAALKFAENVTGVKHIKTCYSRLYGGWYLFLYVPKGKQHLLRQYSWNRRTKEWEVLYRDVTIEPDKLDFHLKGELEDEKCYVLK